jgi:hypothetical protein
MAKRKTKEDITSSSNIIPEDAYVTWGDDLASKQEALKASASSLDEFTLVEKSQASRRYNLDYSNLDGQTGSRPGLTKSDYYNFRPEEAPPYKIKNILRRAEEIYQRVGLVKNVIDLMGDFASHGVRLVHKNKRIERFYRRWFKKINGKDRSERFLNNLYKSGNIIIDRRTAKISVKVADKLYQSLGTSDTIISEIPQINIQKREIPWKYTFIDPVYVDVTAGSLSSFVDNKTYELQIPANLRKTINSPKNDSERLIIEQLPQQIIDAAKAKKSFPLNPDKTLVFHYKKDDWQAWAYPMIYAIMDDIAVIEKLKLADMAALDGAISNIRIFKLGNLEHRIAPTKAATAKLASILGNNVGGGTMDLIWGPDIELLESNTNVHQFLGEGKYTPHLNSIYAGLGIPPTLTGTYGAAGTTNNFISLKTLTQRLQYGRDVLVEFWETEIALVQKAMGFKYPAKIEFDRMDLSNEDAEKALLIQLADRNIISDELIQTRFGFDPDMEKTRLNREIRDREGYRMIRKAGPWHDPNPEQALKKIALQLGIAAPSQVGLELTDKKNGEMNALELKQQLQPAKPPTPLGSDSPESLPGEPQQGRPKNSKDLSPRKQKEFSPQTGASLMIWATKAQDKISELINPILLDFYNKKNIRSLTTAEYKELEETKTKILIGLPPYCKINSELLMNKLELINHPNILQQYTNYQKYIKLLSSQLDDNLLAEDYKQARASFYFMVYNS